MGLLNSLAPQAVSFDAAGETENINFDIGSGAGRVVTIFVSWNDKGNTMSVTCGGQAMDSAGSQVTQNFVLSGHLFKLENPSGTGVVTIAVTSSAGLGASAAQISGMVHDSVGTADGFASNSGGDTAANVQSSVSITSEVGDTVVTYHATRNVFASINATASGFTERQDAADGGGFSQIIGDAAGAASVNAVATWDNGAFAVDWVAFGLNLNGAAAPVANVSRRGMKMTSDYLMRPILIGNF